MVNIYNQQDLEKVKKQKKNILIWIYVTLAIVLAVTITLFVIYTRQEFKTKLKTPLLIANILLCSIYGISLFFIVSIKYKRVRRYEQLLIGIRDGLSSSGTNAYVRTDSSIVVKDGVDFVSLVFLQWSDKKQEYFERNILCDIEKPLPKFNKGDMVHHVTHGNVLISYELNSPEIFE